jgi:hypothetical protein
MWQHVHLLEVDTAESSDDDEKTLPHVDVFRSVRALNLPFDVCVPTATRQVNLMNWAGGS